MRNLKKFERKCIKLHEDFQKSFLRTKSFNKRFEIFNNYVDSFIALAQKVKPHLTFMNISKYNKQVDFFVSDCQNEMKFFLTAGVSYYKKCTSKQESLKLFRKRVFDISAKLQIPDFYSIIMIVPFETTMFKTVTIRHAFNSDKMQTVNGIIVPYYSLVFDSNLPDILKYCLYIRLNNILITSTLA